MSHEQLFAQNIAFPRSETQETTGPFAEAIGPSATRPSTSSTPQVRGNNNSTIPTGQDTLSFNIVSELE